jgi:hypothetical protein
MTLGVSQLDHAYLVRFPFPFKNNNKMTLYLYSSKLKVGSKYLYLTWCAFEHQVRKSSLTLRCRGRNRAMPKRRGKVALLGGRPAKHYVWSSLMPLESMWWHWITLYWSVSHGNELKLLKFSIFEVLSYYPCLYFILSMITMC